MDEDRLRRELHGEVDGWSPEPAELRGRTGSPALLTAIVILVVVALGVGGAAWGLTRGTSQPQRFVALSVDPSASASPSCTPEVAVFLIKGATQEQRSALTDELSADPLIKAVTHETQDEAYAVFVKQHADQAGLLRIASPSDLPESFNLQLRDFSQLPVIKARYESQPGVDQVGPLLGSGACPSPSCGTTFCLPQSPSPSGPLTPSTCPVGCSVMPLASQTPPPTHSTPLLPTPCTAQELSAKVYLDESDVRRGGDVTIHALVFADQPCAVTGAAQIVIKRHGAEGSLATLRCQEPTLTCDAALAGSHQWAARESATVTGTWDSSADRSADQQDVLDVVLQLGGLSASAPVTVLAPGAPSPSSAPQQCAATALAYGVKASPSTYSSGQTATIETTVTNTSSTTCLVDRRLSPPQVSDSSGALVWDGCRASGEPQGGSCPPQDADFEGQEVRPGTSLTVAWPWQLVRDGDATHDPSPVGPGTYDLSWNKATSTITVTG